jgi:hypothetical protein
MKDGGSNLPSREEEGRLRDSTQSRIVKGDFFLKENSQHPGGNRGTPETGEAGAQNSNRGSFGHPKNPPFKDFQLLPQDRSFPSFFLEVPLKFLKILKPKIDFENSPF